MWGFVVVEGGIVMGSVGLDGVVLHNCAWPDEMVEMIMFWFHMVIIILS